MFDCAPDQRETIRGQLEGLFATWIGSLNAAVRLPPPYMISLPS
jgi:hypothetical protein